MVEINKDNLEKSLKNSDGNLHKVSKEEEIGIHKGAITTLVSERNELIKMIGNVEAIMQAHVQRLEELGVKIVKK